MGISNHELHKKDFYAWTKETVQLLKEGKLSEVDVMNIAEEIEDMGISNKRALISHLTVLIAHLLKCKFQAERRGTSWENTIERQRIDIKDLMDESPSLKNEMALKFNFAYKKARLDASSEMGIKKSILPEGCPFTLEQCLDENFFPE
jgi:hypothetical protein